MRADGASYAVTITTGVPRPLKAATAGAVTRRGRAPALEPDALESAALGTGERGMTRRRRARETRLAAMAGSVARSVGAPRGRRQVAWLGAWSARRWSWLQRQSVESSAA